MNLDTETIEGILVVHVNEKRVDRQVSDEFKKDLGDLIESGNHNLIIDLSNVEYMDSGGLGVIVASLKMLHGKGDIVAFGYNEVVSKILTLSGLRNYLKTAISLKGAIDQLKQIQ